MCVRVCVYYSYEEEDYADAKSKMEVRTCVFCVLSTFFFSVSSFSSQTKALDDPNAPGCKLLRSKVTGKTFGAGEFELISLNSLRERVAASGGVPGKLRVSVIQREAREMHREPEFANSLIQVGRPRIMTSLWCLKNISRLHLSSMCLKWFRIPSLLSMV